ncbi:MAG: hypothetical protein V3T05_00645 [Myxococcota bacterium]
MKSAMGWLVILGVIISGAGFGLWQFNETTREQDYALELAVLKAEFQKQSVGLRLLEKDDYRKEIGIALTSYFSELGKITKVYPEFYDIERELKRGETEFDRGRMTQSQKLARDERIAITVDLFNRMRSGLYRPLYTQADKTFRFDIYDITPAKVSGENRVKMSYLHWGAFGPVTYNMIRGNFRAEQTAGKPVEIPQIVGEGQPPNLQIDPERWVTEFPPGMEIGYYDLPQFPRQATAIELSFMFGVRTVGGTDLPINIQFDEIAIPENWKVPEGQEWQAQERFASDDELRAAGAAIPEVK